MNAWFKRRLIDWFLPLRPPGDPYLLVNGIQLYTPRLADLVPYAIVAVLLAVVLSLIDGIAGTVTACAAIGVLVSGIAVSMGIDPRRHGWFAIGFVVWLAAVAVLFVRLASNSPF